MTKELQFNMRLGDYALEACPKGLARFEHSQKNETIDFVKYYRDGEKEFKYSIGYFWWNAKEPCWELCFVGNRFTDVGESEIPEIWAMLKAAYNCLEQWKERE